MSVARPKRWRQWQKLRRAAYNRQVRKLSRLFRSAVIFAPVEFATFDGRRQRFAASPRPANANSATPTEPDKLLD